MIRMTLPTSGWAPPINPWVALVIALLSAVIVAIVHGMMTHNIDVKTASVASVSVAPGTTYKAVAAGIKAGVTTFFIVLLVMALVQLIPAVGSLP
jgi:hypothetical protein